MEQLSNTDGAFLALESANTPQHIAMLCVYDPSTAEVPVVRFKDILETFESRLHRSKVFRRKLKPVATGFDHPFWVDDLDFDIEFHVRHIALPEPGDWRQLCILVARLHSRPIDKNRPLWEAYVIEGLDNVRGLPKGCFGIYTKVHHSAVDGMGAGDLLAALHDLEPNAQPVTDAPDRLVLQRPPSAGALVIRSAINSARRNLGIVDLARSLAGVPGRKRNFEHEWPPEEKDGHKPDTVFGGQVSAHRVFDGVEFPMDDFKTIREAVPGASINDVASAIISIALRKYLVHHNALPEDTLRSFMPVSLRSQAEAGAGGNAVANIQVPIHTDETDPLEVLKLIRASTARAKAKRLQVGEDPVQKVGELMPPPLLHALSKVSSIGARFGNSVLNVNTTISNVPGPNFDVYLTGARMVKVYGLGMLLDGMGLFNVVSSYNGVLTLAATACRKQMPDPEFYSECLQAGFDELKAATSKAAAKSITKARSKVKAKPA